MTALWFLLVSVFALGGVAVLWKLAAVVIEVLREPLPPSLRPATNRAPAAPRAPARPALRAPARPAPRPVRGDDPADDPVALFTRSREAAGGAWGHRPHDVAGRRPASAARATPVAGPASSPVGPTHEPHEPAYDPSWGDLLAETLREVESVRA